MSGAVAAAVDGVRAHLAARVRLAALLWAGAALAAVLVLAWLVAGPGGWAQGSPWPLLLDLLALGLAGAAAAAIWVVPRRWLAEARVTRAMDEAAGLERGSVQGALQLSRAVPVGVSASLAAHGEGRVARRLEGGEARLAGGLGAAAGRWVRRGTAGLALLAPVAALLLVVSPDRATGAWRGLGSPFRVMARPVLPALVVRPGDAEILRGRPLVVSVRAEGRSEVTLRWRAAGDVPRERTVATDADGARFRFDEVTSEIRYSVTAPDGAASREHVITPVDPLLVSDLTVELTFPPHTGRPREEYRGDPPPLVVPAGTRVAVEGRASRALASAGLEREEDGLSVPLQADGQVFSGRWTPRGGGVYAWRFTDEDGGAAELAPAPLDLTVVPDSAPAVRFAFPGRDTVLPLDLRQLLVIEARDDHGLGALELVAFRVTSLGERRQPVRQRMDLGGTRAAMARPVLDLTTWGLLPGDTVRYYARVVDNAPAAGEGQTREYVLRMPDAAEMRRDAQSRMEGMADRLEDLAERAREAGEQARDMERQAAADRRRSPRESPGARQQRAEGPDFSEREELRNALEEQSAMLAEVDSARRELEALTEAMREAGASDPDLQRDLRELQELMEQAAPEEMRARLEEMAQRLGEREMQGAQEALRQLTDEQEAFRERLEQSLERLRRAAVEQDFRATKAEAEELAREERALSDALEEGDQPELRAEQQERLQEEAEALQERIDRLEARLGELGEEDARQGVERANQQTREAREAMEEAGREARDAARSEAQAPQQPQQPSPSQGQRSPQTGEPMREAAQRAQQAAESLESAAQELRDAQQQMAEQKAERAQEALRQTAEEALSLARRQEEIRERMQGPEGMAELRGDEAALMQGVRSMAENLQAAAGEGMDPGAMRQMSGQMGQAMQAIQGTVDAMEGRRGAAPSPRAAAEAAVDALNRLALSAMQGAQSMAQAGQQGGQQGQDAQERLEQLAQQQGSLNNQAGQVMPMQLGQQAMAQQMQDLAQGQQQVAGELGQMAQEPEARDQSLGDLQALAQEAAALAEQLRGGRLDADTRERQERLFHRLLDAGRSLENEEVSEERESAAPGAFEAGEVVPLDPDALGGLPFALPDAAALQRLSPAERQLVLQYFERLNREAAGASVVPPGGAP